MTTGDQGQCRKTPLPRQLAEKRWLILHMLGNESRQNDGNCQPEHDATGAMFTKERGVGVNPACAKYTSHSESEKLKKPERFLEFLWPFHPMSFLTLKEA